MAYLIDGHNLIGQLPDLSLNDPNDEAKLVQKLIGFAARQQKRVVVVFDSGLPGGKSRLSTGPGRSDLRLTAQQRRRRDESDASSAPAIRGSGSSSPTTTP